VYGRTRVSGISTLIGILLQCMIPLSTNQKIPNPKVINGPRRLQRSRQAQ
jgi:hypothetical protein